MEGGDSEKRRDWMRPALRQKKGKRILLRPEKKANQKSLVDLII